MYRQYDLRSDDWRVTCWLRADMGLRVGTMLTLVGDERMWTVAAIGSVTLAEPPNRKWGLALPKGQRTEA